MPLQYGRGRSSKGRIIIALIVLAVSVISYLSSSDVNEVTGEKQYLAYTPNEEIALGLQAAPHMIAQHGGLLPDPQEQAIIDRVGERIVNNSSAANTEWQFEFHLLADAEMVNAFALPGGQVFLTTGLYKRLQSEDQLAGVLAHEIGHVIARHSAQQVAKQQLSQGVTQATVIASGEASAGAAAHMIGKMINMRYGRDDELESDELGVRFMVESGYDPNALIGVMEILAAAGGGGNTPEFFSTHPNPVNRIEEIKAAIAQYSKG
ncbi:MAG: M48 family metalloprotease [Alphaproteobacteria bacterium]|nr:M48 family metalloprotease [Alphaproteobacteria bacterium]